MVPTVSVSQPILGHTGLSVPIKCFIQTIQLGYEYQKAARGALKSITKLRREVQEMRNVVKNLLQLLEDTEDTAKLDSVR